MILTDYRRMIELLIEKSVVNSYEQLLEIYTLHLQIKQLVEQFSILQNNILLGIVIHCN